MPPKCYTTFEAKIMLTFAVFLSVMSPIFPINLLSFVYFQLLLIFIMAVVDTLAVYAHILRVLFTCAVAVYAAAA